MASFSLVNAQDATSSRKGSILVETGLTTFGNLFGGSTGVSFLSSDGESITNIGFSGGKFISENLALRGKFNLISAGGSTFTYISVGPKYYIAGSLPVAIEIGKGFGDGGNTDLIGGLSGGYAIVLANNIYLEPTAGYIFNLDSFGDGFLNLGATFSLLF